jgi:hypothetical protein
VFDDLVLSQHGEPVAAPNKHAPAAVTVTAAAPNKHAPAAVTVTAPATAVNAAVGVVNNNMTSSLPSSAEQPPATLPLTLPFVNGLDTDVADSDKKSGDNDDDGVGSDDVALLSTLHLPWPYASVRAVHKRRHRLRPVRTVLAFCDVTSRLRRVSFVVKTPKCQLPVFTFLSRLALPFTSHHIARLRSSFSTTRCHAVFCSSLRYVMYAHWCGLC